ncbi:MAG: nuclear transport factor 2 family protein [Vicinamibacteraceae bacterium]
MTIIRTLSAFALATACALPALAQSAADEVKAAEKKRFEVTVKGDYKALDAMLADDLIYVHSNGKVDNEKAFLEGLTSGRSKYKSIEPLEMNARQLGEFVFLDGRGKFQVESNGQTNDLLLTYLDVWTKRNGTWQMVHWHSARMPPPAPPAPPAPPVPPAPPKP